MPTVTIVFLVFNRCEELRTSLERMLEHNDYPRDRLDVIVVDNASADGSAEMVEAEFPEVRLVRREVNCGVSGWNDGFAIAKGDYVLVLDDDCYLPSDGLRLAVEAAREREADLVSFSVVSSVREGFRFTDAYPTGLLTFWGCAALIRRPVLDRLRGYDPEIFVWANEAEFTIRFFDAGFRHLHLPEVVAVHMKDVPDQPWALHVTERAYRINARHFGYIAGKLLQPRDAVRVLIALLTTILREALRYHPAALQALRPTIEGFRNGLRHRAAVVRPEVSDAYRRHFHSFASPFWLAPPALVLLRSLPGRLIALVTGRPEPRPPGRRDAYFTRRSTYYPTVASTLEFSAPSPSREPSLQTSTRP